MKVPYYTIYDTKHSSGKANGGTAVIVRNNIKHYLHSQVNKEYLQATTVTVQTFIFIYLLEYLQSILVENFQ